MFKINTLTVKNFMSVGNQTQAIDFNRNDLTLVLGENLDTGGSDAGSRNGTGKTTIINALSYAMYGQALTKIRQNNLINKTNGKNMLTTVEFETNNIAYRIERGRSPNVLKFYVNNTEQEPTDGDQQGDSRETQKDIDKLLGMSHDMFKHIVALNTYSEPFLSMRVNDQREIIEQLLGITLLSEKADNLKELLRITKQSVTDEESNIKATADANDRIGEQVDALKRRQRLWIQKKQEDATQLEVSIDDLNHVDIDIELAQHTELSKWLLLEQEQLSIQKDVETLNAQLSRADKDVNRTEKSLLALQEGECGQCGQDVNHLETHQKQLLDAEKENIENVTYQTELNKAKDILLQTKTGLPEKPITFYLTSDEAHNHRSSLSTLNSHLTSKLNEADPYAEQILEMEQTALINIDYNEHIKLTKIRDHQEFLLKLLTNKDSFIRKKIIDQNLAYLNARLDFYLNSVGLPHTVVFQNDLTVEIQEFGRDLDFDNLSRGERNRLILSLSWAFRDVWESLYQPINLLFIDELVDSGMDSAGVENAMAVLKKMSRERNKSIWLVSHKDELIGRVNNLLKVVKENGFTSYNEDIDVA
jgi:DNA repair exonuclease SbcCD ATPase subunit